MSDAIRVTINGQEHAIDAHPLARLLDVLRGQCRLTGTKEGCGEGECGACAVLVDGVLVNSCLIPVAQVQGKTVQTIEAFDADGKLSEVQEAFLINGGAQCGICTPGMILATEALLARKPDPDEDEIRQALAGNLCRCTGYTRIVESVVDAYRRRAGNRR